MFGLRSLVVLLGAASALAAPHLARRVDDHVTDVDILQFALTLEHLENAFYREGLEKFDAKAFADAGFEPWVRNRFAQIKQHEQTHVEFLEHVLGDQATKPCTYSFPYTDPKSFSAVSMALETVGTSAYLGAAHDIADKGTLTVAASILGVESRQAAWVASAVLKGSAWNGPFDTPLTYDGIYSLASQFIVSCPESNPKLPVTSLPRLVLDPVSPHPKESIEVKFKVDEVHADGAQLYVAWFNGIGLHYSDIGKDGKTTVPTGLQGVVYAAVVKTKANEPTEQDILTGLAMFEIAVPSYMSNTGAA